MDLNKLPVWQAQNTARLVAVEEFVAVPALETEADTPRHNEHDRRDDKDRDPQEPGDRVDGQIETCGDDVVATVNQCNQHKGK